MIGKVIDWKGAALNMREWISSFETPHAHSCLCIHAINASIPRGMLGIPHPSIREVAMDPAMHGMLCLAYRIDFDDIDEI